MSHYRSGATYLGQWADGALPPDGAVLCPAPTTALDTWDGSAWVAFVPVPESVTKLQLRKACLETPHAGTNWWALAKVALAAASADTQEEWDLASVIDRDNATFIAFATSIGAQAADIDAVFQLAATK